MTVNQVLKLLGNQFGIFLLCFVCWITEAQAVENEYAKKEEISSSKKPIRAQESTSEDENTSKAKQSPINVTLAFAQARIDYSDERYAQTHGVYVRSNYDWPINQRNRVRVLFSYRWHQESIVITPASSNFDQNLMLNSEERVGSYYPSFNRPGDTRHTLGWVQNAALGLQWQKKLTDDLSTALSLGFHSRYVDKIDFNFSPWLCLENHWKYFWLSLNYQGDPCMGMNHAQSRLMLGLSLGRAQLGAGWGSSSFDRFDLSDYSIDDLRSGGTIAWLLLPLNASLYLEMSLAFVKQSWLWLDTDRAIGSQAAFMIGLTWTGEREIKELEAPKKMPTQTNSPTQQNTVPQNQPLFSPSPLQPSSPSNSPSIPL